MRIAILALGSRGDVQPFVALGQGLEAAGQQVVIAAAEDYGPLVQAGGLAFVPVGGRIRALLDPALVGPVLAAGANPLPLLRVFRQSVQPLVGRIVADCARACAGADRLVVSSLGRLPGYSIADALGVPCLTAHMHPYDPTATAPHPFAPAWPARWPGRSLYHRASHRVGETLFWQALLGPLNQARHAALGLPPLARWAVRAHYLRPRGATLCAYSPLLAPRPPDWGPQIHVTGDWPLDRAPAPHLPGAGAREPEGAGVELDRVRRFLAAGPPPVYIGFGSLLAGENPDAVTALLVQALAQAGVRGILYRGWGDLGNIPLPPSVLAVDALPHAWLFPQVAAVVHHGGAGTTAAALRAGKPAVIVPAFGDQFRWARRVAALGAGPPPIPRAELSVARLARAIDQAVRDPALRARAVQVGQRLCSEDGVGRAVPIIIG